MMISIKKRVIGFRMPSPVVQGLLVITCFLWVLTAPFTFFFIILFFIYAAKLWRILLCRIERRMERRIKSYLPLNSCIC